jgi:hypothetical protein
MKIRIALAVIGALLLGAILTAQGPAMPFVDRGACPGEGCVYRDWKAKAEVVLYETWDNRAPVRKAFIVKPGETVTAMTGVVIVTVPGRARIRRPVLANNLLADQFPRQPFKNVTIPAGTMVYLLTSHGEGYYTAWANGTLVGFEITNLEQPRTPGAGYSGCVRTQTCDGEVLEYPRRTWWVQIRNAAGQIGWTDRTDAFDGMDALAR